MKTRINTQITLFTTKLGLANNCRNNLREKFKDHEIRRILGKNDSTLIATNRSISKLTDTFQFWSELENDSCIKKIKSYIGIEIYNSSPKDAEYVQYLFFKRSNSAWKNFVENDEIVNRVIDSSTMVRSISSVTGDADLVISLEFDGDDFGTILSERNILSNRLGEMNLNLVDSRTCP